MIYIIVCVEIAAYLSYPRIFNGGSPMSLICINENDVERIFFQENWLSVVSNKDAISQGIYSLLNQVGDIKQKTVDVVCSNLIELKSNTGTRFYIRVKAKIQLSVKFFAKDQRFTYEFISATYLTGYASENLSFDGQIDVDSMRLIRAEDYIKLRTFLMQRKCNFADLTNIRSIKESVDWLASQTFQLKTCPTYSYCKKAS